MLISRNKIKALGKKLRGESLGSGLSTEDLEVLSQWRDSHGPALNYQLKLIEEALRSFQLTPQDFSLSQRLKRIYSIKLKLKRFPNMQLSMMDDVAGARVVLESIEQVQKLYGLIKENSSKNKLLKVNNYLSNPKLDGYRGIHLVYRTNRSLAVQLELQIRTKLQHIWATAVEVFGTIVKTSFKTGEGEDDWRRFFKLLSTKFAQKEKSPILSEYEHLSKKQFDRMLIESIRSLNIIEKLNAYTADYSSDWGSKRKQGRMGKYALLTLNNIVNTTEVTFYAAKDRLAGLKRYSELEKKHLNDEDLNFVFISVNDMNKLQQAYPNYFMDTQALIKILSLIVLGEF
jgi:hypothetical protein